jgi:hypothetical protein
MERDDARVRWAAQTDTLLSNLSQSLLQPSLAEPVGAGLELVVVAGRLAGLPLHAATFSDGRYVAESFDSVTYCPNISALPSEQLTWQKPSSPLFVVSDRAEDLTTAARECQLAVETIGSVGAATKVFAQVGDAVGRAAFSRRGITLDTNIDVVENAPTPERLAQLVPNADHFFYSGHGVGRANRSGLMVVDDNGTPTALSENDILSMHVLRGRPVVVLSACETAMGGHGSSELFDMASSFLRVGARFVVGSLWLVIEDYATTFTAKFYAALASGESPSIAFGKAALATKQHRSAVVSGRTIPANHPIYWAPFMALRGN